MQSSKSNSKKLPSQLKDVLNKANDQKAFEDYFFSETSRVLRDLLVKWAIKRLEASVKASDDPSKLALASYSEQQAWQSGYRTAYREFKNLLDR